MMVMAPLELRRGTGSSTTRWPSPQRAEWLNGMLSLRHFRLARSWSLSLRIPSCGGAEARVANCGSADDGDGAARAEARYGVIDNTMAKSAARRMAQRHALASTFPAGAIMVFIPSYPFVRGSRGARGELRIGR